MCIADNQAVIYIFIATEKAVVCSCSSMVAILSNLSIPFITDRNKEMLKTSKLHPAAFAASVCYNCYSTIYGQAYSLYRSRPFACGRDSMMNPQHIRGHNVNPYHPNMPKARLPSGPDQE